jgi:hypothetical protein
MKKQLLITALFLAFILAGHAQSSGIKIMDLKNIHIRTATGSGDMDTTQRIERIYFKIDQINQADSACFSIGTTAGACDVMRLCGKFVLSGSQYFLVLGGKQFPGDPYEPYVEVPFTNAIHQKVKFISLYVRDKSHLKTNTLTIAFH